MWVEMLRFTLPGDPRGKGRPRFKRFPHGKGRTYTDADTRHFEDRIAAAAMDVWDEGPIDRTIPLRISVLATFKRPANRYRVKDQNVVLKTSKPDLDNIVKSAQDGLERAGIIADQQIVAIAAQKEWAEICDRKSKTCGPSSLCVAIQAWIP